MSSFFVTAPKGMETLLADELTGLGASACRPTRAGVAATGTLETMYRACLWSRLANRVLLPLQQFSVQNEVDLYDGIRAMAWHEHLGATDTLAVDFAEVGSAISHTQYGALKVKDAVVDYFRDQG